MKARDTPLSPEEAEAHRLAGLDRISKELCEDLALKHAKTVDSEVGYRFREIASYLYRLRRKPLNAQQEKDLSRALSELDRVLLKPVGGPAMDETEMDPREIQALSQCLIAQDAAGFSPFTLADILIRQWERDRKRKMFRRNLNKMMVRCCGDNKSPHNWLSRSPIFSPLLVEWNRDRDALWDFIEAC
ncbi:MAG: hypothetical protein ABI233_04200, partial [Chthoniobacterales bacterium]